MNMPETHQYVLDNATGVWARPDYASISYSDGDEAEDYVAGVIKHAADLSALSPELFSHCRDWSSLYHLSPARGNILRPFEALLKGSVLEIGAGCGAISRFLGECGAQVLSLEGSLRRATTAASRTRDLSNVTVLAERFDDFTTSERFDAVTLIGVLEYASMFSTASNPALHMLRKAAGFLKPGGRLFIAIENQLGLKYFAGAPEDHLGVPMYGIEGRYDAGQPQTFGRAVLTNLLKQAGFVSNEFLAPVPDYKLPQTIITERGMLHPRFDAASLLAQSVGKDPQLPDDTHFDLHRTWPEVIENGLGMELANSFLVCATTDPATPAIDPSHLAYHYSTGRRPAYCKEACFAEVDNGIQVHYRPLAHLEDSPSTFIYKLPSSAPYKEGVLLSNRFIDLAAEPDWSIEKFAKFFDTYLQILRTLVGESGSPGFDWNLYSVLPGELIDAVPSNIIVEGSGSAFFIDQEWCKPDGIKLGHLLVRAILLLLATKSPQRPGITRGSFVTGLFAQLGLAISLDEVDCFVQEEAELQEIVTGRPRVEFLDWQPMASLGEQAAVETALTSATLYWADSNGAFDESRCTSAVLLPETNTLTLTVPYPVSADCSLLRFDPVDQPGLFNIESLILKDGENELWSWDGEWRHLTAISGLLKVVTPDGTDALLATDSDPSFYISLPAGSNPSDSLHLVARITLGAALSTVHAPSENCPPVSSIEDIVADEKEFNMAPMDSQAALPLVTDTAQTAAQPAANDSVSIDSLSTEVASLRTEVDRLQEALTNQQIAKDTHIHNLNLHIMALQGSTSWLVTAPLRKASRLALRARRILRILPSIIRRGGGFAPTSRKALNVLRTHGIAGCVARIRRFIQMGTPEFIGQESRPVSDRNDYAQWVAYYDTLDDDKRWRMKEDIRGWKDKPLISIIMPVYNPPLALLNEAVESVRRQIYPNWELCIADDASSDPEVSQALRSHAAQDSRIKVVFRERNGHISEASNSALELAKGEFIALMDNDDLLAEQALYWVVKSIKDHPDAALLYSDEDKIDEAGRRSSPYFKPSWNKFLFRSQNMVCHLGVYRASLVRELKGFREGYEGSQDYDLALRCMERIEPAQIVHIPRVLYHWRVHQGSTALAGNEKPYAAIAGVKALADHLERSSCTGEVELLPTGMYRVHYSLPDAAPLVSLIIPTRNAHLLVKQCIDSIIELTSYPQYEIILIDNGSDDPAALAYFTSLEALENVRVIHDGRPFNYSALNNRAVEIARGELVALINNDIEVITPDWLSELVAVALQPGVGAVGARLWYPDDRLQHGGVIVGVGGVAGHSHKYLPKGDHGYFCRAELLQEFSAVTAACLVVRKAVFEAVGGLDEEHLVIAFNDVDFCLRLQEAGYVNVWTPYAELYHHESATRGLEDTPEKKARFASEVAYMKRRWPRIQEDYAYNPNLTLDHEDFGLAWPPRVKI